MCLVAFSYIHKSWILSMAITIIGTINRVTLSKWSDTLFGRADDNEACFVPREFDPQQKAKRNGWFAWKRLPWNLSCDGKTVLRITTLPWWMGTSRDLTFLERGWWWRCRMEVCRSNHDLTQVPKGSFRLASRQGSQSTCSQLDCCYGGCQHLFSSKFAYMWKKSCFLSSGDWAVRNEMLLASVANIARIAISICQEDVTEEQSWDLKWFKWTTDKPSR